MNIRRFAASSAAFLCLSVGMSGGALALDPGEDSYELKLLGKYLFFDKISIPSRQACASCHAPAAGWTNGHSGTNLKQVAVTGANPHTVGTLKPPSAAYASFHENFDLARARGGNFWNGRATGEVVAGILNLADDHPYAKYLGPTADQAHASPFINPVEQGLPDIEAVCELVKGQKYAALYPMAYDNEAIDCDAGVEITFARFALAIAAYEHSADLNAFDAKRDRALRAELACLDPEGDFQKYFDPQVCAAESADNWGSFPLVGLTDQENLGHDIFYDQESALNPEGKRGRCGAFCHRNGARDGTSVDETYGRDRFFNIGVPYNVEIPGNPAPDIGVEAMTGDPDHRGEHKLPTLRNVDKRPGEGFKKAYMHNGYFKSLESVVHFYNTRDAKAPCDNPLATEREALAQDCWPAPEIVHDNIVGGGVIGNLGLTADDEAAIVAYMKALTDIPTAKAPEPFSFKKFNKGQLR